MEEREKNLQRLDYKLLAGGFLSVTGFLSLGPLLLAGVVALNSRYILPESCSLSPNAVTLKAVSHNYQQCKTELIGMNLEKQDKQFSTIAVQLTSDQQLTNITKNAFEAVFDDVQQQFEYQKPQYVRVISGLLVGLFLFWLIVLSMMLELLSL